METALKFMARNWWILLLRGVAAILFGISAFVWPGLTLSVLVILLGAYLLFDGVIGTIDAIRYREDKDNWVFWLLDGIIGIIAGGLMLFLPGASALVLLILIASWAIVGGVLRIIVAFQLRKKIDGEWLMAASGVLSILFGILLIAVPNAGLVSIAWLIGFWALILGVVFVMLAFRLRKLAD